jgi:O-antigen/teichoic acid export membrane protein
MSAEAIRADLPSCPSASQRVVRNSVGNLIGQTVNAACNLIVVFVLARYLGKELLGQYFTVFAVLLAVQMTLESGITTTLTCRMVQFPENWRRTVAEANGLLTIVILASVGLMVGIGFVWARSSGDPSVMVPFLAASFSCGALQVERFCAAVFRAFEQFRFENVARVIQGTAFAGLVCVGCWLGIVNPAIALALLGVSHIAAAVFLIVMLQRHWKCFAWRLSWSVVKDWVGESVPLGMGDVVRRLTWQLDTLLLAALQPAAVVGIYSVAYRPLGPLNWVPRAILTAAFPSFARMATNDRESLDRSFASSTRLLWIISLPIAVAICIGAKPIIVFLAGAEYLESAIPMRLLIWISAMSFLSIQFRFLYTAVGRQSLFAALVIGIFLLEAIMEWLLIPRWGYMGACAGSLVGELLFTAIGLALCGYLGLSRFQWSAMLRAALAGAVMAGVIWPGRELPLLLLAPIVLGAVCVYFALCVLLGALSWEEVRHSFEAVATTLRARPRGAGERMTHKNSPAF